MSNPRDEKLLDENLSRLLDQRTGPPRLAEDAATEMLDQLKVRQVELFTKTNATPDEAKEQPMNVSATLAARSSWNTAIAGLLALAAVILLALLVRGPLSTQGPGDGATGSGAVAPVAFGQVVRTTLDDGTILIADRRSKYSVDVSRRITLDQGNIYLIVAKSDAPFVVTTADGEIRATGTRFAVSRDSDADPATRTAVAQGRVTLVSGRGDVRLRAGQQGVLRRGQRPTREPAPRLSYLVNWAKEALGQEERLVKQSETPNGLVAVDPWGQEAQLTLRRYDVDVVIEDGIARTTIDQTFFNHNPWNTEGTFYFPLPPDASVSRLAMYVAGRLNEGGMVERGRGQQIYNDILYQRRDPALLEMMEGNIFKMRIFPLEGRQEKRIFLSYTQTLQELYGTIRYWFPMDHTNSVAGKLSIRVRVKDSRDRFEARSSTHEIVQQMEDEDLVLTYAAENTKPDQDFLLHLTPSTPSPVSRVATCQQDGYQYLLTRFTPKLTGTVDARPRQWIVLNDVSASRSAIDVEAQRYVLGRLIEEADDDDTVLAVDLNTEATPVSDDFVSVRSVAARRLTDRRTEVYLGATNIEAGLKVVAQIIRQHAPDNPHILYLGDGMATDGKTQVAKLVGMIPDNATFIGIGVGKKVDLPFLQTAADVTGGFFTTINPDEDIDWRVFDLVAALNTPRLTGIDVTLRDASGGTVDAVAYPNTRTLTAGETLTIAARCAGRLPTSIAIEGRVGDEVARFDVTLDQAPSGATYIPRFWAKRHIDALLKSGSEHNEEVVELSKQYYVVTPLTSLIVLEDDKMYEEYKVERGRKDHWALYPAPAEIEVVREPIDWSRGSHWGWWGGGPIGEDEQVQAVERPETVKEIVDSVQFRINAPFYYWRPQPDGQDRSALYALTDTEADPTKLLTYWLLRASGKDAMASDVGSGTRDGVMVQGGDEAFQSFPVGDQVLSISGLIPMPQFLNLESVRTMALPFFNKVIDVSEFNSEMLVIGNESIVGGVDSSLTFPTLMFQEDTRGPLRMLMFAQTQGRYRQLPMAMRMSDGSFGGLGQAAASGVPHELRRSFERALGQRRSRIRRDIQKFNRPYGYWHHDRAWNALDLRRPVGARGYGGLEGILEAKGDSGKYGLSMRLSMRVLNRERMAVAWVGVYDRSLKTQPGACSILAADYLFQRKAALQKKRLTAEGKQELKAIEHALASVGQASARLEDSGPFWGRQGWNYRPQPWTFQPPTIQAHPGYHWSFDLTRYAPGLYTDSADVLNEVVSQYAAKPRGKVTGAARRRIESARKAIRPFKIREPKSDVELLVAAGDRFAMTRRTEMELEEKLVCDGQQIVHLYDELGLAARRPATPLRLASLRQRVPHLLAPADWLARQFDVEIEKSNDKKSQNRRFTLRLTPIGQGVPADKPKKAKPPSHLLVRVDAQGRIEQQVLMTGTKRIATLAFDYEDQKVTLRWLDADDKQRRTFSYRAEPLAAIAGTFDIDLSDHVVFDMPLRKPSYYVQQLERLDEEDAEAHINLKRHHALASIQQLHRRRWHVQNEEARKSLADARQRMQQAGIEPKLGDLVLLGSTGAHNLATIVAQSTDAGGLKRFADHPASRYFTLRLDGWQVVAKLHDEHLDGLIGHMAAYHAACLSWDIEKLGMNDFETFTKRFPDSPLLLAAAYNGSRQPERWSRLYEHPRLKAVAIMMSAATVKTPEQKRRLVTAFEKLYHEVAEAGNDLPMTPQIVEHLRSVDGGRIWKVIADDKLARALASDRTGPLLQFAEQAMSWGDADRADKALQQIRERLKKQPTLRGQFALAQCYWAGGRLPEALEQYDEILQALEARDIAPSPALLAAVARLAQQAGQTARAIEFEERALAAEHPYLPERINLQAFRQRYTWLWQQYQSQVQAAVAAKDQAATADWLARATAAWQRWVEVDRENPTMITQMATLQQAAGQDATAWLYLSTLIDQRPKDATSYYAVGQWYRSRNKLDETQSWYERAYQWDTANPRWLYERAQVLDQLGRKSESRTVYQQIIDGQWAPALQGYVEKAKTAVTVHGTQGRNDHESLE